MLTARLFLASLREKNKKMSLRICTYLYLYNYFKGPFNVITKKRERAANQTMLQASLVAQVVKNFPAMWETGSILESRRFPGEGNGNPFQYSCLENSMDRGAWQATVHGLEKSRTRLSN